MGVIGRRLGRLRDEVEYERLAIIADRVWKRVLEL